VATGTRLMEPYVEPGIGRRRSTARLRGRRRQFQGFHQAQAEVLLGRR